MTDETEQEPGRWARLKSWQQLAITVGGAGVALALVGLVQEQVTGDSVDIDGDATSTFSSTQREVTYELEGTARVVDITIETPTGTSQQSDVGLPLTNQSGSLGLVMQFSVGDFVYISAQNALDESTTVTCRILVDGEVISENTASGGFSIATCKGSAS